MGRKRRSAGGAREAGARRAQCYNRHRLVAEVGQLRLIDAARNPKPSREKVTRRRDVSFTFPTFRLPSLSLPSSNYLLCPQSTPSLHRPTLLFRTPLHERPPPFTLSPPLAPLPTLLQPITITTTRLGHASFNIDTTTHGYGASLHSLPHRFRLPRVFSVGQGASRGHARLALERCKGDVMQAAVSPNRSEGMNERCWS